MGITRNSRTRTEYRTGTIPKNLGQFLVPLFPYFRFSVLSGRFRFGTVPVPWTPLLVAIRLHLYMNANDKFLIYGYSIIRQVDGGNFNSCNYCASIMGVCIIVAWHPLIASHKFWKHLSSCIFHCTWSAVITCILHWNFIQLIW